ncbi:uncharacterized protein L969DRAFT_47841 [Mixia osmundae IAM 14324]|uniref:Mid2 domain-containing protein n=1 Tax=Mixia osmundae (strain CBS 9802 / IAM 14324 / JCM 22182 / KY 12970) TaxID=764103 RepID=G7E8Z0_MIXOS|nr:uncharacterized protein L969DRAFT_47841 [Mixia osmundae IAM 14324]KEI40244.1 hypothetical protein L969DRAFT_47841 [Mixia osmundae IAM 14324]GAA99608.1 hypothetical protein E5Q_06309 [Mixia osmundae IAM 14324]
MTRAQCAHRIAADKRALLGLLVLGFAIEQAAGQQPQWTFGFANRSPQRLQQCTAVSFTLTGGSNDSYVASPPYTLTAYAIDGSTVTANLGDISADDGSDYAWNAPFAQGERVVLSMVDNDGVEGGVTQAYTVGASDNATCLSASASDITVTVDAATSGSSQANVAACGSVNVSVTGGSAPYQVLIVPVNADGETRVTLPSGQASAALFNGLSSGAQFFVTAQDSTGSYAANSSMLYTTSSGSSSCQSDSQAFGTEPATITATSAGSTTSSSSGGASSSGQDSRSHAGAIAGGVAGGVVALLLLAALIWFISRRKRRDQDSQSFYSAPFKGGNKTSQPGFVAPAAFRSRQDDIATQPQMQQAMRPGAAGSASATSLLATNQAAPAGRAGHQTQPSASSIGSLGSLYGRPLPQPGSSIHRAGSVASVSNQYGLSGAGGMRVTNPDEDMEPIEESSLPYRDSGAEQDIKPASPSDLRAPARWQQHSDSGVTLASGPQIPENTVDIPPAYHHYR